MIMKRILIAAASVLCFASCNNSNSSDTYGTDSASVKSGVSPSTLHPKGDTTQVDSARTGTMTQGSENGNGSGTHTNPTGKPDSTK